MKVHNLLRHPHRDNIPVNKPVAHVRTTYQEDRCLVSVKGLDVDTAMLNIRSNEYQFYDRA